MFFCSLALKGFFSNKNKIYEDSIQGIQGAFHEVVARKFFTNVDIEIVLAMTFAELVDKVENEVADIGAIAVENTISGMIHHNLNLVQNTNLQGQFLNKYPSWNIVETEDTALSIKLLAENKIRHIAAIGSSLTAQLYGLNLVQSIETNKLNNTRFGIISKNKMQTKNINKSSLSFIISNKKGSLAKVLAQIAEFDINLTKLESVPIIGQPWNYMFFADFLFNDYNNFNRVLAYFRANNIEHDVWESMKTDLGIVIFKKLSLLLENLVWGFYDSIVN